MGELPEGLCESLITSRLDKQLAVNGDLESVLRYIDSAEQPEVLSRHVRDAAFRALSGQRDPTKGVELSAERTIPRCRDSRRAGNR